MLQGLVLFFFVFSQNAFGVLLKLGRFASVFFINIFNGKPQRFYGEGGRRSLKIYKKIKQKMDDFSVKSVEDS